MPVPGVKITAPKNNAQIEVSKRFQLKFDISAMKGANIYINGDFDSFNDSGVATLTTPQKAGKLTIKTVAVDTDGNETELSSTIVVNVKAKPAGPSCAISEDHWSDGYVMKVTLTNNSDKAVSDWSKVLKFNQTPDIVNHWNSTLTISGKNLIAKPVSHNSTIPANGNIEFGFQGNFSGQFVKPTCE